jgi:quercetin dioxygenase-like cupin family protein
MAARRSAGPARDGTVGVRANPAAGRSADRSTPAGSPQPDPTSADLSEVIGHHLRTFRKELGLTLRGLSERSGLSIGFLSQLERGLTSIGLTTLRDLAVTLGHDITDFFDEVATATTFAPVIETPPADVIRTGAPISGASRRDLSEKYFTLTRATGEHSSEYVSGQRTYRMLAKRARDLVLEPMLVTIAPGGIATEMEVHAGEEFAYVIEGQLCYTVDGVEHRLYPGDSLHLKSAIPHSLYNDTDQVVVVVSVVTPRLF